MARLRVKANKWDTNFWCRLLGHIIDGYGGGTPYGRRSSWAATDGMGIVHQPIDARCDRCDQDITVIKIHEKPTNKEPTT